MRRLEQIRQTGAPETLSVQRGRMAGGEPFATGADAMTQDTVATGADAVTQDGFATSADAMTQDTLPEEMGHRRPASRRTADTVYSAADMPTGEIPAGEGLRVSADAPTDETPSAPERRGRAEVRVEPRTNGVRRTLVRSEAPAPASAPRRDHVSRNDSSESSGRSTRRDTNSGSGSPWRDADVSSSERYRDPSTGSSGRRITLKEAEEREKKIYERLLERYKQDLKAWRSRLWIPFAALAGVLLISLIVGAYMGVAGVILVLLLGGGTVAILAVRGDLLVFKKPKKPTQSLPVMDSPDLDKVFAVKVKLRSTNISHPVEIAIRNEEQIIGSSKDMCPQPLPFRGISRVHCTFITRNQHGHTELFIRDEHSRNGTRLNGEELAPETLYSVKIGDVITIAKLYSFKVTSDAI